MELFDIIATLVKMIFVVALCLASVPICVWFERRGSAWIQGRLGPNRVGPFGLIQPMADALKFFFKEDFIPAKANKFYYLMAPIIALVAPLVALTTVPFGSHITLFGREISLQIVNFDAGIMLALAFIGLEVYPIILAGWSSNNKYSMMGAIRGSSQIVSYEIAMGLSLISMLVVYGTFDMNEMVAFQQAHTWGAFINPLAALIFWICIFAETNRLPFDLPEGDAEIVAGFHLEYGAMKFALFFMAEYVAMIMASLFLSTIFFGGYALLPGFATIISSLSSALSFDATQMQNLKALFEFISLFIKVGFFMFVFVWVRWTLPRFRFDQLMDLGWKALFPLALFNLVLMSIVSYFIHTK